MPGGREYLMTWDSIASRKTRPAPFSPQAP
jgi:hypothetical protein